MPTDILDDLIWEEGLVFSPKKDNCITEVIDLEGDTAPVVEEKDYDLIWCLVYHFFSTHGRHALFGGYDLFILRMKFTVFN